MSRKFIEETVCRIDLLMKRHVTAQTYLDLNQEDNKESMELVSRIEEIADAMKMCRARNVPCEQRELYAFAETVTEEEISLFRAYFRWFRSLSTKDTQ
ncbi:MAG: hypothetical protein SWE60_02330 [Thermodesulfobacteriota bacterium]|nr:hypothetical protein [Thermodesulfobacteriota bacterium]